MQKVNRYISKRYLHQGRVSKISISPSAFNVLMPTKEETKSIKVEEPIAEQPIAEKVEIATPIVETPIIETIEDEVEEVVEEKVEEEIKVVEEPKAEEQVVVRKESAYAKRKREKDNNK